MSKTKKHWEIRTQNTGKCKVVEYKEVAGKLKKRTLHKNLERKVANNILFLLEKNIRYNVYQVISQTLNN